MCAAWREQVEEERPSEVGGHYLNLFNLLKSPVLLGVGAMA